MENIMTYGKWDSYEEAEVAFAKVKSGEWDLSRFEEWCDFMKICINREACADESY
jgi:hypothetical protein